MPWCLEISASSPGLRPDIISHSCEIKSGRRSGNEATEMSQSYVESMIVFCRGAQCCNSVSPFHSSVGLLLTRLHLSHGQSHPQRVLQRSGCGKHLPALSHLPHPSTRPNQKPPSYREANISSSWSKEIVLVRTTSGSNVSSLNKERTSRRRRWRSVKLV